LYSLNCYSASAVFVIGRSRLIQDPCFEWRCPKVARIDVPLSRVGLGRLTAAGYTFPMTRTLEAALAKLATLPTEEQDRVAGWLLDELRDDENWARQFDASQDALSKLAAEARADRAAKGTTDLDLDKL
jgi:hypothetical protein